MPEEGAAATPTSPYKPLIALTGATGFIGQHLLRELPKRGYRLRVLLRRPSAAPIECASALIGDLARPHNMSEALAGADAVIHSAGVAQTMSGVPEDDYRLLNTEATIKLARAAERAGVRRFVFLSSIRAQSGSTAEGSPARGLRASADRRLWQVQARCRAGIGRDQARLGGAQARARLWPRRAGQHGAARRACPLALSAAAREPES